MDRRQRALKATTKAHANQTKKHEATSRRAMGRRQRALKATTKAHANQTKKHKATSRLAQHECHGQTPASAESHDESARQPNQETRGTSAMGRRQRALKATTKAHSGYRNTPVAATKKGFVACGGQAGLRWPGGCGLRWPGG